MLRSLVSSVGALVVAACAPPPRLPPKSAQAISAPPAEGSASVGRASLCVESGRQGLTASADSAFRVDASGLRAIVAGVPRGGSTSAELAFDYRGPSTAVTPLASGEHRRQVGLKLRAKDTCNLVYVMWHVAPTRGIFVSVKHNPGKHTHAECGAGGYINVRPERAQPPAPIEPGDAHRLRAELGDRGELAVFADGREAWRGRLPAEALTFDGPPGVRSDNAAFTFTLAVDRAELALRSCDTPAILR